MINMNAATSAMEAYLSYDAANSRKTENTGVSQETKTEETKKNTTGQVKLSAAAQELLEKIKEKYGNMDVFVADYSSDEEASRIMSRGTREYSVLFTPDELEKMAQDEDYASQQLDALDNAVNMGDELKEKYSLESALNQDGDSKVVTRFGITINGDGTTSFFAQLEELTAKQKERLEEAKEKKAEEAEDDEKTEEEKIADKYRRPEEKKTTTLTAGSLEELMQQIEELDWSTVKEGDKNEGPRFDFTV
jgi:hypothetical protein